MHNVFHIGSTGSADMVMYFSDVGILNEQVVPVAIGSSRADGCACFFVLPPARTI